MMKRESYEKKEEKTRQRCDHDLKLKYPDVSNILYKKNCLCIYFLCCIKRISFFLKKKKQHIMSIS
eukprot:UN02454